VVAAAATLGRAGKATRVRDRARMEWALGELVVVRAAEKGAALLMAHVDGVRGTCGVEVTARAVQVRVPDA
jgi:hypothetical protein